MRKFAAVWVFSLFAVLGVPAAFADGMPVGEDGRFTGGETIIIGLTGGQKAGLASDRVLKLNAEQRRIIRKVHGFSPSSIFIYDTRTGENDCTCSAYNRGLLFSADLVEVPRVYLVTDKRAREIEKEFGAM